MLARAEPRVAEYVRLERDGDKQDGEFGGVSTGDVRDAGDVGNLGDTVRADEDGDK